MEMLRNVLVHDYSNFISEDKKNMCMHNNKKVNNIFLFNRKWQQKRIWGKKVSIKKKIYFWLVQFEDWLLFSRLLFCHKWKIY